MPRSRTETPQQRSARARRARRGEEAPEPKLPSKGGRKPGTQLRAGVQAKEAMLSAFERLGGVAGLVRWGKKNPTEFYRLWARLIPREDNVNVTAVGVEELLAQLDEHAAESAERLSDMDAAGAALGLPRPEAENGTVLAFPMRDGGNVAP